MSRHEPTIAELGAQAEQYFASDANVCVYKLRQLGERMARLVAARHRVYLSADETTFNVLRALEERGYLSGRARGLFHDIRRAGNDAVHALEGSHGTAAKQLRNARLLCLWFEGEFGDPDFKAPGFELPAKPPDPSEELARAYAEQEALTQQLAESQAERDAHERQLETLAERLSKPRVVFADAFLRVWRSLNDGVKERLGPDLERFRDSPDVQRLDGFDGIADPAFRWLPMSGDYCAVIAVSPGKDVLLCSWIGEFEPALDWVRSRRVEVHPELGSLQVYETVAPSVEASEVGLFDKHSDEDLVQCGVPHPLLPAVRELGHRGHLSALSLHLPAEAADALFALADGADPAGARRAAGINLARHPVDPSDFDSALSHRASRRAYIDMDDRTFEEMLRAPLDEWRIFLHPSQRRVVETQATGPVRVLGGAGTGKTVALVHRAAHLIRHRLAPEARVLCTTFTRTMADELRRSLSLLLSDEEMARVEVSTLHSWATGFLYQRGHKPRLISGKAKKLLWKEIVDHHDSQGTYPVGFYMDEWELVVLAQGITGRFDYRRARRTGRGTRLNRRDRDAVWNVFAAYRAALDADDQMEFADAIRLAKEHLVADPSLRAFRAILVDEVQDFGQAELELLRAMVEERPGDLFLVGDAHQRIYKLGCSMDACGIHIRGRSHKLRVNYRTTQAIQRFALEMLGDIEVDDLDGGVDDLIGYRALRSGLKPTVEIFDNAPAELSAVVQRVGHWIKIDQVNPSEICIAARSSWLLKPYVAALGQAGIETADLHARSMAQHQQAVQTSTMHRLKGTEFSRVLLVGVQRGTVPLRVGGHADEAAAEDHDQAERCLMYVAATRGRDRLAVTGVGEPSPFLPARVGVRQGSVSD